MYFLRTSTKRTLGEETFQREIMAGLVNASLNENLLWNIERTVSNVFIPLLNTNCMGDKGSSQLLIKVILCYYVLFRMLWHKDDKIKRTFNFR